MTSSEHSPAAQQLQRLLDIMARLRDPETGCAWDVAQTPATIAPYSIEEAYEVADAIEREAWTETSDELGDLLLQVVFQARMAEEAGHFDFATVAMQISDKMVRRHPHVFGETETQADVDLVAQWEAEKERERIARADTGALAGVPRGLPALLRARKLAARAARVGFDWPDVSGVFEKIREETEEVRVELESGNKDALEDEIGDLLFAVASLARRVDLDPEACLRRANDKFTRRFKALEALLAAEGLTPAGRSVEELDAVWREVKRQESSS